ncbi:hypothetical protein F4821DRAFT_274696 [Hypoxylon rubiginosum]|uniref:Uncharacterized protein n=1 Tax=Hypoxylon rubiginosum TaxID=110542 RepID=A0ACC0DD85_9PEZI|nr:hypothetical protein F4821DRAFT_274696 [Hypoxylon rubiginosum]
MRASYSLAAVALFCHQAFAQCLNVLANNQEVSDQCSASVSEDAVALCSSYLATSTVHTATSTPVAAAAVATTTETITSARTEVVFTRVVSTETEVVTSTTSTTVTATASPVGRRQIEIDLNFLSDDACSTLTGLPTDSVPSSAISSACSCLGVSATATTTVSTVSTATPAASSTVTKSVTVSTTKTSTSTIVAYTKHTTTTTVATATQTASYDRCSVGYTSGGNGKGNRSENVDATSSQDCCEQCQEKQNCVASVYTSTTCQHLIKVSQLSGAKTSDQCPLGIEDYAFGDAGGMVYQGPCGY